MTCGLQSLDRLAPGFYLMSPAVVSGLVVHFSFREARHLTLTRTTVLEK